MKNYKLINNVTGWVVFLIATITYILTIEPTTSFWDCGEFIANAYKLEVGHPPGAPIFMIIARFFSLFAMGDSMQVAKWINTMSALASSFTILFLFWTITYFSRKIVSKIGELTPANTFAIMASGVIGALAYTWSDTFWFSAVEGEVYALSSFFTAIVFWAVLKWEDVADERYSNRWLILIFYLIGLSLGVHLLNLLSIPVIAYVIYFRKYEKITALGFILTGIIGVVALGLIQAVVIPKTVQIAGWFERVFVNNLGMGFNTGTVFFFMFMLTIIAVVLIWSKKSGSSIINTITWSGTMILMGYSCFAMIVIRSNANTPLDENDPENLVSLESYLKREQYGDWPILKGQYFNSQMNDDRDLWSDRSDVYLRRFVVLNKKNSEVKGFKYEDQAIAFAEPKGFSVVEKYYNTYDGSNSKPTYKAAQTTFFPRMYSAEDRHVAGYKSWSLYNPTKRLTNASGSSEYKRADDERKEEIIQEASLPSMGENLTYFSKYQVGWMYWRYFMWNFSGRQNDEQGHGDAGNGNWISGLNFIDSHHIGDQSKAPSVVTNNPGHNEYYMLPLILGLIGFIFMLTKSTKGWWLVMLLFLLTGFAIIIYLNQKPMEPRERDYAYAASFYAFSIWIGMSVLALYDAFKSMLWKELGMILGGLFLLGLALAVGDMTGFVSMMYMTGVIGAAFALMILLRNTLKQEKQGAIIAIALAFPIPILMGVQAWDDHDRSNRYTAQALAQNYLNSCEDNAIIFTNGDNDTFPLWYLQEVENTKTSVRVCNLSLLNTDWYTEQMTRKAYDSEPLPISFSEEQFRQYGNLDYLYVLGTNQLTMGRKELDKKWKKIIEVKIKANQDLFKPAFNNATNGLYTILASTNFAVMKPDFLAYIPTMDSASNYFAFRTLIFNLLTTGETYQLSDNHLQAIQNVMVTFNDAFDYLPATYAMEYLSDESNIEDRGIFILPSKGMRIPVDIAAAKECGILTEEYYDRAETEIMWTIPKSTMYKNDLMILDMVAHFEWKRPIYFAGSADKLTYLGLDKYFLAEGLVYKLVPVQVDASRNPNSLGEVNTTRMYENLMSTFNWGNMDVEGTLVDYYNRRLTNNYRVQFSVLADAYGAAIEKGQQKLEIMNQIEAKTDREDNDAPIKTPIGDFIPSKIPEQRAKVEAEIKDAMNKITEVISKSIEVMPHVNVPFGKVYPSYVSALYMADNQEMAEKYSDIMFELFGEEMTHYLNIDPKFSTYLLQDMYSSYRSLFSLYQTSKVFGTNKDFQDKTMNKFHVITAELQEGLTRIRLYNVKEKNTSAITQIENTFVPFFARVEQLEQQFNLNF